MALKPDTPWQALQVTVLRLPATGSPSAASAGPRPARPAAITHAVHSGHRYAMELGGKPKAFRRDAPIVEFEPAYTSIAGLEV